ncbi:hypothetical protein [Corynebacterium spheniscorum]|nr:hypothetical protein [Corynebacterium spheniscorum]
MRTHRILMTFTTPILALSLWLSGCSADPDATDNPSPTISGKAPKT